MSRAAPTLTPAIARRFMLASGLTGLAFGLELSGLPLYFSTLDLPAAIYGLLVGAAWLVALVVRMPIGVLSLRFGNRVLLTVGCWLYAPLSWLLLVTGNVPLFFSVRMANGVARSFLVLPLRSWFTELCPRERLHTELGRLNSTFAVGQSFLGLFAGPWLLGLLGPPALLGLLGLLPLLIWWLLRPAPRDYPAESARAAAGEAHPRLIWVAAPCGLAGNAALSAAAAFVPQVVLGLGWPPETVGILLTLQGAVAVLLARQNGPLVGRWGEARVAMAGLVFVAGAAAVLYGVNNGVTLPVAAVLAGAGSGILPTLSMGLAARSLASRSQGISVHETYTSLGLGAGPFLGGLATQLLGTPRAALLPCLLFAAFAALAIAREQRTLASAVAHKLT